MASAGGG
ncbi:hypothetical protein D030_3561A, partial [Vibrio parahaemolyticus AQ3810]